MKVDFVRSPAMPDGGLILVRELDRPLALDGLTEPSLRQKVCSRLAGYEDVNGAARLSQDPNFRLIASEKIWERREALTLMLQPFETKPPTPEGDSDGLRLEGSGAVGDQALAG